MVLKNDTNQGGRNLQRGVIQNIGGDARVVPSDKEE